MTRSTFLPLIFLTALSLFTAGPARGAESGYDHTGAGFTRVLAGIVKDGKVDYAALKRSPDPLGAQLAAMARVTETEFNTWSRVQRMAFLLNLYNAATLKLVIDHYPVKSIKDIGGLFGSPWEQEVVHLFGRTVTLNHLEHDVIRPGFGDPRVHFALVCAARGCPVLRPEAYVADRLDAQLDAQGRDFLRTSGKNRVSGSTLYLSPVFKWYKEDFTGKSGSVESFVAPYFPPAEEKKILAGGLAVKYTDYDWSLNRK